MNNDVIEVNQNEMTGDIARAMHEVQAAIISAKKFPRHEQKAVEKINQACSRKSLATISLYSYPRGGQMITGPSIRLAEVLARYWGNLDCGVKEVSNDSVKKESVVQAYCIDLETNYRVVKEFTVKHERATKARKYALTDPRDIYEHVANSGARRLRACILAVIPGHIVEEAVQTCEKALHNPDNIPLADRITKMCKAFKTYQVSVEMIEERLGHKVSDISNDQIVELTKIFNSLKDGVSQRKDWFTVGQTATDKTNKLNDKFSGDKKD